MAELSRNRGSVAGRSKLLCTLSKGSISASEKTPVFCLMDTAALSLEINQQERESLHISPTSDQLHIARR